MKTIAMRSILAFLLFVTMGLWLPAPAHSHEHNITIGVLAWRPAEEVLLRWQAFTEYLEESMENVNVTIVSGGFDFIEDSIDNNELDFVLTSPSHYIRIRSENTLSGALATLSLWQNGEAISGVGGVVFTTADRDDINTWEDLRDKTIAITAQRALGSYQMQAYELQERGLPLPDPSRLIETGLPVDLVVRAVLEGRAEVGFVRTGLLETLVAEGALAADAFKVVAQRDLPTFPLALSTRLYPEMALVSLPHVPEVLSNRLLAKLMLLQDRPDVTEAMGIAGFVTPRDYAPVEDMLRALHLPPFDVRSPVTLQDIWEQHRITIVVLAIGFAITLALLAFLAIVNTHLKYSRLRAEETARSLAESEQKNRAIISAMPDMLFRLDAQGTFIEFHGAKDQLADPSQQFIGRKVNDVLPIEVARQAMAATSQALRTGQLARFEYTLPPWGLYEARVVRLFQQEVLILARDITERRKMEVSLLRQAEEMQRLAEVSAHHLKEPSRRLISYAGFLRQKLEAPLVEGDIAFALNVIEGQARRLNTLVHGMQLHLTADQGDEQGTTSEAQHVRRLVLEEMGPVFEGRGGKLAIQTLPAVPLDPIRLKTILLVLLDNAARHSDPASPVSVEVFAEETESGLLLKVADTGPGIPEPFRERVYRLFEKLSTVADETNVGIGLAIVRRILESVGGKTWIEETLGGGTTVVLQFPYQSPALHPNANHQEENL